MVVDSHGNPIHFEITGGEVHDSQVARQLIQSAGKEGSAFIADKAYDSEDIRETARQQGMKPIIPRKKNSKKLNPEFDKQLYKLRHLVENIFAPLKHFRGIATRFEKLKRNYQAAVSIACSIFYLRLDHK
jgi:transposase